MDKIFLPNEKKWIYPPYPFTATITQPSEKQVCRDGEAVPESGAVCERTTGADDVNRASGIKTDALYSKNREVLNEPLPSSDHEVQLHQQVIKCEEGFQFEDVEPMTHVAGPGYSHGTDNVELWDSAPGCSNDLNFRTESVATENSQLTLESEDRVSPPPKRPRKRRKAIVEEEVEQ
ncbi:unnamed protein product, partial [Allacma fusca]